jgi:hypothetical protein
LSKSDERCHSLQTDHIAVLLKNLEAVSESLPQFCTRHPRQEWPGEGTVEQYISTGGQNEARLLLMQPIGEKGPYSRALCKRGPGLHHIGCITKSIPDDLANNLNWNMFLHPISLSTFPTGCLWLCRPGVPFLVELRQEADFTEQIGSCALYLPVNTPVPGYARSISTNLTICNSSDNLLHIEIGNRRVTIDAGMN